MVVRICLVIIFWLAVISAALCVFRLWRSRGSPSFSDLLRARRWLTEAMVLQTIVCVELMYWWGPGAYILPLALTLFCSLLIALYQYRPTQLVAGQPEQ
jgi:hypothetical protein